MKDDELEVPTCAGLMKSSGSRKNTWQVMATYNKTNHIITLHVFELVRLKKIDTKHIVSSPGSIVNELHSLEFKKENSNFAGFWMVEQISGWFTIMGLHLTPSVTQESEQIKTMVTLMHRNTYLMQDPSRWGQDFLTVNKEEDFCVVTRHPFVKVFHLQLITEFQKKKSET